MEEEIILFLKPINDGRFIISNEFCSIYNPKNKIKIPEVILPTINEDVSKLAFPMADNTIIISHFGGQYLEIFYPDIQGIHVPHIKPDYIIERNGIFVSFVEEFPNKIYCMGTNKGTIEIWSTLEKQIPDIILDNPHKGHITLLIALKDNYLASGGIDSNVKIWDIENKICKFVLKDIFTTDVSHIICIDDFRLLAFYIDEEMYYHNDNNYGIILWDYQKKLKVLR